MEGGSVQIKNIRNHLLMSISIYHVIKFNKVNAEAQIETNIIEEISKCRFLEISFQLTPSVSAADKWQMANEIFQ